MTPTRSHYRPVDNGYEIVGSRETFNRTLYGSHKNDHERKRYLTFAGDAPIIMGAFTDWADHPDCKFEHTACHYAKNGVLMSGLALTPGLHTPHYYSENIDNSSRWFHTSEDIIATFRNGWMEYKLRQFTPWFPDVTVEMEVYPLMPDDGFLVRYKINTDQRVIFCAGFGGVTDILGRFEYNEVTERNFHAHDCAGNEITCGSNRASIKGGAGDCVRIGASFPVNLELGDAQALQDSPPGIFLGAKAGKGKPQVVKMSCPVEAGETLEGFIVVTRNESENVLEKWLNHKDPVSYVKQQIYTKHSGINVVTPNKMLNQTIPVNVLAIDASWHERAFHHGAFGYHAPFMGWRNWYGPTIAGWYDRVRTVAKTHFSQTLKEADGEEKVWYDGKDREDLNRESNQYHQIKNSIGRIPCLAGGPVDIYNMQSVGFDMLLHYLNWTGDLELAKEFFEGMCLALDWEERILDYDNDGLYQNFLNTWISDGHSYNGGGCAQASAYNYKANRLMAKIAEKLNMPADKFERRAAKILKAVQEKLWIPSQSLIAEFVDTIGNKLIHPSPELSTVYLAIECGLLDMFQSYTTLRFTETEIRNGKSLCSHGRLAYSSNWYPKKYSTCGVFPAENSHLALVYFILGLKDKAMKILDGLVDCYFVSKNPGQTTHVLTGWGVADVGDLDFSDASSMYLRLIVEGLFGIRINFLEDFMEIAPNFPVDWTHANLKLKDASLNYCRTGSVENFNIYSTNSLRKRIKIALRSTEIEGVLLDGMPVDYKIQAGIGNCFLIVETSLSGLIHLQVAHGRTALPKVLSEQITILEGNDLFVEVTDGEILECNDISGTLSEITVSGNKVYAKSNGATGNYTLFVKVKSGKFVSWLTADFAVEARPEIRKISDADNSKFEAIDISKYFNTSLDTLHTQKYLSPRPEGYSIGVLANGRYAWEWNQSGFRGTKVNDLDLRKTGELRTASGISFSTPAKGDNIACAAIWDNFPTVLNIPLTSKASELALAFIGVTNVMQAYVENVIFTVSYQDGTRGKVCLIHPHNFDDWLVPALQTENETVYFSDYNHATVQRISLDPAKELSSISIEAIANEIIIGVMGISIKR
jgi:hypothetical protein